MLALQHEHDDGVTWSDTEPAEDAAAQATEGNAYSETQQSQEELQDGPTDITDSQQAWDTIQRCSVIVGMHPDQVADVRDLDMQVVSTLCKCSICATRLSAAMHLVELS